MHCVLASPSLYSSAGTNGSAGSSSSDSNSSSSRTCSELNLSGLNLNSNTNCVGSSGSVGSSTLSDHNSPSPALSSCHSLSSVPSSPSSSYPPTTQLLHNNNQHHQLLLHPASQQFALPLIPSPTSISFSTHFIQGETNTHNYNKKNSNSNSTSSSLSSYLKPLVLYPDDPNSIPDGETLLPVECGPNSAILYLSKLCQGSKGQCIRFNGYWLTPNEFQYISGRETAKDWKRSIRHNGKSIKLLISKGVIRVHSPICECGNRPYKLHKQQQQQCQRNTLYPSLFMGTSMNNNKKSMELLTNGKNNNNNNHNNCNNNNSIHQLHHSFANAAQAQFLKNLDLTNTLEEEKQQMVQKKSDEVIREDEGNENPKTSRHEDEKLMENQEAEAGSQSRGCLDMSNEMSSHILENNIDLSLINFNGSTSSIATITANNNLDHQQQHNNNTIVVGSVKREARLTSIIDHLLISRTNEAASTDSVDDDQHETHQQSAIGTGTKSSASFQSSTAKSSSKTSKKGRPSSSIIKNERQSPESVRSSPSPKKDSAPTTLSAASSTSSASETGTGSGGMAGGPPASPPLKQMEQMMSRNYSDFMRSLAAKYNHSNPNDMYPAARSSSFTFDTRFLKPGAAAAAASLIAFQQQHQQAAAAAAAAAAVSGTDKIPFPLIDMSSTQTLLSMVRSAAVAAASNPSSNIAAGHSPTNNNGNRATPNNSGSLSLPTTPPMVNQLLPGLVGMKRPSSPLDLSSASGGTSLTGGTGAAGLFLNHQLLPKKMKHMKRCGSSCSGCSSEAESIANWTIDDVCNFVSSIDLCAEYTQAFRDHSIDGTSLPLLTEDHLIQNMNMKLGPALKFKSTIAKKLGNCPICIHCIHCHINATTTAASTTEPK